MTSASGERTIEITPNPHRVRVLLGGVIVAETTRALSVRESGHPLVHYVPREDVDMGLLEPSPRRTHCPLKGEAVYFTITAHGLRAEDAAWSYENPLPPAAAIKSRVAFYSHRVDAIEELI